MCSILPFSFLPFLQHHSPRTLPGALDTGRSRSWVLFKRLYRQANSGIDAGKKHSRAPRGRKGSPDSAGGRRERFPGDQDSHYLLSDSPVATETPVEVPKMPELPLWLVSVFSNTYEWKEKVLKIYHPPRLLFPVKLSGFSLSFLFGMRHSGLFWQPEGATKISFLGAARVPPVKATCCGPGAGTRPAASQGSGDPSAQSDP